MAITVLKSPKAGSVTFSDGDTDFIITSDKVSPDDAVVATARVSLIHFNDAGQRIETTVSLNFPRLGAGWGANLASTLYNFFSRVDMGRAGQCFCQDCCVIVQNIDFVFSDGRKNIIDQGETGTYSAVLVNDPLQHGYTDIYEQDKFLYLTSYCPTQKNGYFAFSYMQSMYKETTAYLVLADGTETLLAQFGPENYHACFYNVAGHFPGDTARLEIRSGSGTVLAYMDMAAEHIESYDEHLLYLPSSLGTPELFVCTGEKTSSVEINSEVFELRHHAVLTDSTSPKTVTIHTGYLSEAECGRLYSLLPAFYECALDGEVCWLTGGDPTFISGRKNDVSLTLRMKWN